MNPRSGPDRVAAHRGSRVTELLDASSRGSVTAFDELIAALGEKAASLAT